METNDKRNFRPSGETPKGNNELIKKSPSNDSGSNAGTPTDEFIDIQPNVIPTDADTDRSAPTDDPNEPTERDE